MRSVLEEQKRSQTLGSGLYQRIVELLEPSDVYLYQPFYVNGGIIVTTPPLRFIDIDGLLREWADGYPAARLFCHKYGLAEYDSEQDEWIECVSTLYSPPQPRTRPSALAERA